MHQPQTPLVIITKDNYEKALAAISPATTPSDSSSDQKTLNEATTPITRSLSPVKLHHYLLQWRLRNLAVHLFVTLLLVGATLGAWATYRVRAHVVRSGADRSARTQDGVALLGTISVIDPAILCTDISWTVVGTGAFTDDGSGLGAVKEDISIFADGIPNALINISASSYQLLGYPAVFDTKLHMLDSGLVEGSSSTGALLTYPFDEYYVQTTFNAVLSATGKQIPITAVVLNGVTQGWNIATTSSNSSYSPLPGQLPTDATSASYFQVNLKRADVIRAYVVLTAIVSWAVTAACVGTAIQVCVWGRDVALPVILLMATVLFALPTLRATNPGIPEVGCLLDVLSFLIQEILVALCLCSSMLVHMARVRYERYSVQYASQSDDKAGFTHLAATPVSFPTFAQQQQRQSEAFTRVDDGCV